MTQLQSLLTNQYQRLNLLLILGGFLTILVELIYTKHISGAQSIGLYSTVLGAILVVHGLVDVRVHKVLTVVFLVLCLFGAIGAYKHYTSRSTKESLTLAQQAIDSSSTLASGEMRIISPPLAAPLAISGLSMFAALTLLAAAKQRNDKAA